jgi:RNA polymerase sigma-70 factor (sigma-E family)
MVSEGSEGQDVVLLGSAEPQQIVTVGDLADLYQEVRPAMVRLAHLLTGSSAIAEEVVQDSFVALYHRRAVVEHPRAYLRQIVVNGCHSHARKRASEERQLSAVQADPSRLTHAVPPEVDEMRSALDRLVPRQRTALVLRYYEDLPVGEIAEIMGARPGTVKSLIHRRLANLREVIER